MQILEERIMNKQALFNQVMEQLVQDKDILAFVEQLQVTIKDPSTLVEEPGALYQRPEELMVADSSIDLPQPYLQLLQKTVKTTLEAALGVDEDKEHEQFIGQSFNRFDDIYKALS